MRLDRQGAAILAPLNLLGVDLLGRNALLAGKLKQPEAHRRLLDRDAVETHPRPRALDPMAIEIVDVPKRCAGGAGSETTPDVPVENHHLAALEPAMSDAGLTHAVDDCRPAVVFSAAFARGRIDRNANRVDRPVVWDRLAFSSRLARGKMLMPSSETNKASSSCDAISGRIVARNAGSLLAANAG